MFSHDLNIFKKAITGISLVGYLSSLAGPLYAGFEDSEFIYAFAPDAPKVLKAVQNGQGSFNFGDVCQLKTWGEVNASQLIDSISESQKKVKAAGTNDPACAPGSVGRNDDPQKQLKLEQDIDEAVKKYKEISLGEINYYIENK